MHIHILGIVGSMTANLAVQLKKAGNTVTGSDQEKIFPPFSNLLKKAKISVNTIEINKNIDLIIVGSSYQSFKQTQEEFDQAKKLHIPYVSATEYLSQNLVKKNSIVIAGSFGKTTITSLVSWIFSQAHKKPSYMFGGISKNKFDSLKLTNSNWSIIEGDESIHGLDQKAKFFYYYPKYLLITSADWEHKDCYPTAQDNTKAFKKLVNQLPPEGILFLNQKSQTSSNLSHNSPCKTIFYGEINSDYFIEKIQKNNSLTTLIIHTPNGLIKTSTRLIGQFNYQNILAAITIADSLKISPYTISKAITSYKGVKRRLELVDTRKNILFFDDFAQSGDRINSTLKALKEQFPSKKIKVLFQPHASFIQYKQSLCELKNSFDFADEVVLTQLKFNPSISKKNRNTAKDFRDCLGDKLIYLPLKQQIIKYYKDSLMPNDILIYMSSGGLEGTRLFKSIINSFKK